LASTVGFVSLVFRESQATIRRTHGEWHNQVNVCSEGSAGANESVDWKWRSRHQSLSQIDLRSITCEIFCANVFFADSELNQRYADFGNEWQDL